MHESERETDRASDVSPYHAFHRLSGRLRSSFELQNFPFTHNTQRRVPFILLLYPFDEQEQVNMFISWRVCAIDRTIELFRFLPSSLLPLPTTSIRVAVG